MPWARRTNRLREVVRLIGHGMGGRPGERLLSRLGMPVSDDTILRHQASGRGHWRGSVASGSSYVVRSTGNGRGAWRSGFSAARSQDRAGAVCTIPRLPSALYRAA
jgi:hypothetical protein